MQASTLFHSTDKILGSCWRELSDCLNVPNHRLQLSSCPPMTHFMTFSSLILGKSWVWWNRYGSKSSGERLVCLPISETHVFQSHILLPLSLFTRWRVSLSANEGKMMLLFGFGLENPDDIFGLLSIVIIIVSEEKTHILRYLKMILMKRQPQT